VACVILGRWRNILQELELLPTGPIDLLISELERLPSLDEAANLRERLEALDRIDAVLPEDSSRSGIAKLDEAIWRRAEALRVRLEARNSELYDQVRDAIRRGAGADALLQWIPQWIPQGELEAGALAGLGYDYLDELIGGIFAFDEPEQAAERTEPEMVFYQPTPARHILRMLGFTRPGPRDVFIDIGSGMGHVVLLAAICTGAECVGIEIESAYVRSAQRCAERLNVANASFLSEDARTANLSRGTIFYLHTPFSGGILREVLERLRLEASHRQLRICTYGPCTAAVAAEPWLEATVKPEPDQIAFFRSRG